MTTPINKTRVLDEAGDAHAAGALPTTAPDNSGPKDKPDALAKPGVRMKPGKTRVLDGNDDAHDSGMNSAPDSDETGSRDAPDDALGPGDQLLHGQYRIEQYLSAGGFGITYLASDSLERKVVIKECFPNSICCRSGQTVQVRSNSLQPGFREIVSKFREEALRLAKLDHPNIVRVHQVFEDRGTAYMALDFVDGKDLFSIIEDDPDGLTPLELKTILLKLLDAVAYIHDNDILHRDISPDNILLDDLGNPVLIDFGAAREVVTRTSRALSPLQVVKDGYSPQEFYLAGGKQSEASDIYSLAATFYHLMTGTAPPNSQVRIAALAAGEPDPYVPVPPRTEGFDRFFLGAIDDALAVFQKDRLQSAVEWIQEIDKERRLKKLAEKAKEDADIDLSIKRLLEESNTDMLSEEDGRQGQQVEPGPGTPAPASATAMKTRPGQPAGKIDAGKRIASTDPASAGQSSGAMPDKAIQPDGTSRTSPRRRSLLTRIASVPILLIKGGKPSGKSRDHGFERHNQ